MTPRSEGLGLPPLVAEAVAGLTAGCLSTLLCHPLDLIKMRLQVDRSTTNQRLGASYRIYRAVVDSHGFRGLYRGLGTNMTGNMMSWSLYFILYEDFKLRVSDHHKIGGVDYFLASGAAGVLSAIASNPLWVLKTRILSTNRGDPGAYLGLRDGVKLVLRADGPKGLMRGLVPAMFGVTHGSVQFMCYEKLKEWRQATSPAAIERGRLHWTDHIALSGLSKIIAASVAQPYKVVQTRLQFFNSVGYKGPVDVVKRIAREEGARGFYKGLAPSLVRVLPSTCITFLVYENTRLYLKAL